MKLFLFLMLSLWFTAVTAFATSNVAVTNYYTTTGSSTAYTQVIASTPITVSQMYVCDTSGLVVKVASGASGSEVDLFTAPISGCAVFPVNPYLVAGSRLTIRSGSSTNATTGYNSISLLP